MTENTAVVWALAAVTIASMIGFGYFAINDDVTEIRYYNTTTPLPPAKPVIVEPEVQILPLPTQVPNEVAENTTSRGDAYRDLKKFCGEDFAPYARYYDDHWCFNATKDLEEVIALYGEE